MKQKDLQVLEPQKAANTPSESMVSSVSAKKRRGRVWRIAWTVVFGLIFVLGVSVFALGIWYKATFDLEFKELLYTLASPLKGTGNSTVLDIVTAVLPAALIGAGVYVGAILFFTSRNTRSFCWGRRAGYAVCAAVLVGALVFSLEAFRIPAYLQALKEKTTIYEDWYIDPEDVVIAAEDGKAKNLIYIYLESMETTYASVEEGGKQAVNYMPNLTRLAKEHITFTDKEEGILGGFHTPLGTGWTIAALMATSSGIPFSFPLGENGNNDMSKHEIFAGGLTTLGDILAEKGYRQEFLCGSNVAFAGRDLYYEQHGNYELYDLYTARREGVIAPDYHNGFWGFEDEILYQIAKDELTELAASDQPFNLTMLTVDTHHVAGYICELCGNQYSEKTANVVSCADRQIADFVAWCMEQDFYEDTVIVITGDHPRMDTRLIGDTPYDERVIYNCIINSAVQPSGSTTERVFTSFDLFPTTLAAMGFSIEGERLGLGVNMFADRSTVAEELGYEVLAEEINKFSDYYIKNFS